MATAKASTWILGEFNDTSKLLDCVRTLRTEGWTNLDTYSPFPIHGAEDAMGLKKTTVPLMAFGAAMTGVATGYGMQWFFNSFLYPLNVGNRLAHSPVSNVPITFELGILLTALSIFFGLVIFYFQFPRPHHPVFEVEAFRSATTHAYWVSVQLPGLNEVEAAKVKDRIAALGGGNVSVVEDME